MAQKLATPPRSFPEAVYGTMSPYPTVQMVMTAQ